MDLKVNDLINTVNSNKMLKNEGDSKSESAKKRFFGDYEMFMKMFITQLQHQDPLDPQDASDFAQQLASFSTVEQTIAVNSHLEKIENMMTANPLMQAASILGKNVSYEASVKNIKEGQLTNFEYELSPMESQKIMNTEILILSDKNEIMRKLHGATEAGVHNIDWDSKNSQGELVKSGKYHIKVISYDQNGNAVSVNDNLIKNSMVQNVEKRGDETLIKADGIMLNMKQILAIS